MKALKCLVALLTLVCVVGVAEAGRFRSKEVRIFRKRSHGTCPTPAPKVAPAPQQMPAKGAHVDPSPKTVPVGQNRVCR